MHNNEGTAIPANITEEDVPALDNDRKWELAHRGWFLHILKDDPSVIVRRRVAGCGAFLEELKNDPDVDVSANVNLLVRKLTSHT